MIIIFLIVSAALADGLILLFVFLLGMWFAEELRNRGLARKLKELA